MDERSGLPAFSKGKRKKRRLKVHLLLFGEHRRSKRSAHVRLPWNNNAASMLLSMRPRSQAVIYTLPLLEVVSVFSTTEGLKPKNSDIARTSVARLCAAWKVRLGAATRRTPSIPQSISSEAAKR